MGKVLFALAPLNSDERPKASDDIRSFAERVRFLPALSQVRQPSPSDMNISATEFDDGISNPHGSTLFPLYTGPDDATAPAKPAKGDAHRHKDPFST